MQAQQGLGGRVLVCVDGYARECMCSGLAVARLR